MQRPISVTVFGVLNLIFAAFGLLGLAASVFVMYSGRFPQPAQMQISPFYENYTKVMLVLGVASSVALGLSGLGLLALRSWGRLLAVGYAVFSVISTIVSLIVQWYYFTKPMLDQLEGQGGPEATGAKIGAVSSIVGATIGMAFPVLLGYFMTRPNVIEAFRRAAEGPGDSAPGQTWDPALSPERNDLSNPYLSPAIDSSQQAVGPAVPAESIVGTFVPSKNGPALAAYYLGLLSLFPCLGFPLGVAAVYFGIRGIRRERENPAVRGANHAWVGVICGTVFGAFNFLLLVGAIVGFVIAATNPR